MSKAWKAFGLALAVLCTGLSACTAANKVTPLKELPDGATGLFYMLPQTALVVEIPITVRIKNGAFEYVDVKNSSGGEVKTERIDCKKYLKESDYEVVKSIEIGEMKVVQEAVPDQNNIYVIDVNSSFLKDSKKDLHYNEQGMLVSGMLFEKDKTLEFSVQVLNTVASFVGAAAGVKAAPQNINLEYAQENKSGKAKAAVARDEAYFCNKLIRDATGDLDNKKKTLKNYQSRREALLFGNNAAGMDTSVDVYKLRMAEIDKIIAAAQRKTDFERTVSFVFRKTIIPEHEGIIPLFGLSEDKIVTQYLDAFGGGVPKEYLTSGEPQQKVVSLVVERPDNDMATAVMRKASTPQGTQGLYYRLPSRAKVHFINDTAASQPQTIPIAQWGPILALPSRMGSADSAITFEFFTDTGALKSIGTDNKALDMEQVGKFGEAGVSLVKAVYASNDELARLSREKEKLTLQKDIRDLRQELQPAQ